jgi:uncharacterized SAM-binding protein YcdF (DUF218 family)
LIIGMGAVVGLLRRAGTALVVTQDISDPDLIVSLSSHEWERLPVAARLARRFPRARVALTQPRSVSRFNCHDCPNRVENLSRLGVELERIGMLELSENGTFGEALATLRYMSARQMTRVVVVTSPYHTRRALATFRNVLAPAQIAVGIVPAFPESPAVPARWWTRSYDRWYVRYEWPAIVVYRFRHGVPWALPRKDG